MSERIERLARRIARGDRTSATASAYAEEVTASASEASEASALVRDQNVHGCHFVLVNHLDGDRNSSELVRDEHGSVAKLEEIVRFSNRRHADEITSRDYARLRQWAREARPGDAIDGWWNVTWIFAIRNDARSDSAPNWTR